MNNPFEMVVFIVLIVMVASVLRSIFGARRDRQGTTTAPIRDDARDRRLRDEVRALKERLAVLERITVEKENSLEREIERLRDR